MSELSSQSLGDGGTAVEDERPRTPDQKAAAVADINTNPEQIAGGSIILIDPSTNGIIGTLTPASPDGALAGDLDPAAIEVSGAEINLVEGVGIPNRRDPTYSYRLSISDVSLRTVLNSAGTADEDTEGVQKVFETPHKAFKAVGGDIGGKDRKSAVRSSYMTDDASFWTARGTLRCDSPISGTGQEREREVVVAYVKTDTPLCDLFPPYIPTPTRPTRLNPNLTIGTHRSDLTTTTDSPFPSRILHLFPRLSTLPRGGVAGSGLPSNVTQGLSWPSTMELDPASIFANAGSQAEKAFWRLVMPGISGIYGWTGALGQAYEQLAAYLPIPLLSPSSSNDNAPLLIDSSVSQSAHQARLYSEETIYTLRLPETGDENGRLDIGPTVRPVWVKKRAALPVFVDKEEGWGRDGMRFNI